MSTAAAAQTAFFPSGLMTNLWTSIPVWYFKHTLLHLFEAPLQCFCYFHWGPRAKNILVSVTETLRIKASGDRTACLQRTDAIYCSNLKLLRNDTWLPTQLLTTAQQGAVWLHTAEWNRRGLCCDTTQQGWGDAPTGSRTLPLNAPCNPAAESDHWVRLKNGMREVSTTGISRDTHTHTHTRIDTQLGHERQIGTRQRSSLSNADLS